MKRDYSPEERAQRSRAGSKGIYRVHAARTPAERSEVARRAAEARWAKHREEHPDKPHRDRPGVLSATELKPWLEEADRRWPDREWRSHEERRREALLLARQSAADAAYEALRESGGRHG